MDQCVYLQPASTSQNYNSMLAFINMYVNTAAPTARWMDESNNQMHSDAAYDNKKTSDCGISGDIIEMEKLQKPTPS